MTTVKAKFKNGVLEPLSKVNLPEGEEVTVRIELSDINEKAWLDAAAQDTVDRIATLEADLPENQVAHWHEEMNRAAKPAQ